MDVGEGGDVLLLGGSSSNTDARARDRRRTIPVRARAVVQRAPRRPIFELAAPAGARPVVRQRDTLQKRPPIGMLEALGFSCISGRTTYKPGNTYCTGVR
jgi:hypothetical protein